MPILFFSWKSSRALFCTSGVFKHLSLLSCCPLTSEIPHQQKRDHIFSSSLLSSEICSAAAAEALGSRETAGVQSAALIIPPPASSASLVPAIVGKLLENGARVSLGLPQALLWCHTGLIPAGCWTRPGVWGALDFRDVGTAQAVPVNLRGRKSPGPRTKLPFPWIPSLGKLYHLLPGMWIFQFPEPSLPTKTSTTPCRE